MYLFVGFYILVKVIEGPETITTSASTLITYYLQVTDCSVEDTHRHDNVCILILKSKMFFAWHSQFFGNIFYTEFDYFFLILRS